MVIFGEITHINGFEPEESMNVAFLSLGGNLFDRAEILRKAVAAIAKHCGKILKASQLYETQSWGFSSAHLYLNQVVKIETTLSAKDLLKSVLSIETSLGRKRKGSGYSDRSIDIDLLFYNSAIVSSRDLILPHPRLQDRKFVLIPLQEIAPKLIHPVFSQSVSFLLKKCKDRLQVTPFRVPTFPHYICIEGNIGSGKSTLARYLATHFKANYVAEEFQKMHLLPLFYTDPKLYAFTLEFSFLIHRFEQLSACFETQKGLLVSDFSLFKSLYFAKVNLKKKEYTLFKKQFDSIHSKLPEPDLIIHVSTSTANLIQNIRKRGRSFEQNISTNYLEKLDAVYRQGFGKLKHIKQLHIEVKNYHPKLEKEHHKVILKYIKDNFGQTS